MQNAKCKIMEGINFKSLILSFVFLSIFVFSVQTSAMLSVKANHNHVKIGFFYHGTEVSVSGEADPGTDLIIKVTSPEGHQVLRKKSRVAGFLWMNVGKLKFEHIPTLYFIHSTRNIENILSQVAMDKYTLGYPSLKKHMEITPVVYEKDKASSTASISKSLGGEEKKELFNEFIKFKESSKLYSISSGKISTSIKDGRQSFYIKLDWPYQALPGDYTVTAYAVKDKKVIEKAEANVFVKQVDIVNAFTDLANKNGALYGIISIIVALGAGFGVSMIFREGGGAH